MALVVWNDNFSVQVAEIDRQHQKLIAIINELDDAIKANHSNEAIGHVLAELLDYTKTHFEYEENLLSTNGYPMFDPHKAEHDALAEKVVFMGDIFAQGQNIDSGQLMNFLKFWIEEHILEIDKKYSAHLNSKGVH
ncbi:MAG: hypothetical protein RIT27_2148 [Pseudomonadota bacterium]|jgi:hemerythrin